MTTFVERNIKIILILPAVLLLLLFTIYPLINLGVYSFSTYSIHTLNVPLQFNGLDNIKSLFQDEQFRNSVKITLIFVFVSVLLEFTLGWILALFFYHRVVVSNILQVIFIIPMILPPITIGLIWRLMYNPEFGVINQTLRVFGSTQPPVWLADPDLALLSVIVVEIWHWTPFVFLLMLAGMHSLPTELYEAAAIDGASAVQRFRYITAPLLRPIIFTVLMFRTIMCFKAFDQFFILTSGGPGNRTEILGLYIYKMAFAFGKIGYSSALALMAIFLMILITLIFRAIISRVR